MANFIWVTTQKEMLHRYPEAPEGVKYLKNLHRHLFKFKIYLEVKHDNRDIEFIKFKHEVNEILDRINRDLKRKSCEMLSNHLAYKISKKYPGRDIKIEVSEDGENGSEYYYTS